MISQTLWGSPCSTPPIHFTWSLSGALTCPGERAVISTHIEDQRWDTRKYKTGHDSLWYVFHTQCFCVQLRCQLSAALLFDAVHVVVGAVQELNRSQEIGVKPLSCTSPQIWQHGTSLMNYLRMVSVWTLHCSQCALWFNCVCLCKCCNITVVSCSVVMVLIRWSMMDWQVGLSSTAKARGLITPSTSWRSTEEATKRLHTALYNGVKWLFWLLHFQIVLINFC